MARDYKNRNQITAAEEQRQSGSTVPFLIGLGIGLGVAGVVYVVVDAGRPPPVIITEIREAEKPAPAEAEAVMGETNTPPPTFEFVTKEPAFEFYKILPNKEINISELVTEQELTAPDTEEQGDDIYILQVGSFRNPESAQVVKANLALLGMQAEIQEALIRGRDIRYRVRLGPYSSIQALKAARKILYENKYEHIERKQQAE